MAEVLVTGGSGYIGSWCVLALLNAGHSVRTTVRNQSREPELRTMLQRAGTAPDAPLRVLTADLTRDAGWPEAVRGCDAVLHVASPTLTSAPRSDVSGQQAFPIGGHGDPQPERQRRVVAKSRRSR
jgi:nucleoside-diphosphate-sugar epimerase